MLQRLASKRRDACPSPHVTVRGITELRRAVHVVRSGKRPGYHAGKGGLVKVGLKPGAVGGHVGQAHGVVRRPGAQTTLRQRLRHGLLTAQRGRQLQLRHAGHSRRGPTGVVCVERAKTVAHRGRGRRGGGELLQAVVGRQQGPRAAEHVGGLLALLPLGAAVLEPDLGRDGGATGGG